MPSFLHDALVLLFKNHPALAAELLERVSGEPLPDYEEAVLSDASLGELVPTERRADAVVLLRRGEPLLGIVVEVQLRRDEEKEYVWPLYQAALRARWRCPVALLVVCPDANTASWAAGLVQRWRLAQAAIVVGPEDVPHPDELEPGRASLELAVLAAQAHGNEPGEIEALAAIVAAVDREPEETAVVYFDLILKSLGEAARRALEEAMQRPYEFQSDFARKYYGQGRVEGLEEGIRKGREEGQKEARRSFAMGLLARGVPVAEVVALTGLPEEEIRLLQG